VVGARAGGAVAVPMPVSATAAKQAGRPPAKRLRANRPNANTTHRASFQTRAYMTGQAYRALLRGGESAGRAASTSVDGRTGVELLELGHHASRTGACLRAASSCAMPA